MLPFHFLSCSLLYLQHCKKLLEKDKHVLVGRLHRGIDEMSGMQSQAISDGKQNVISGLGRYFRLTYMFHSTNDSDTDFEATEIDYDKELLKM